MALLLSSSLARAAAPPDCSNPQAAAATLFGWLQPDAHDPTKAATCLSVPNGEQGGRLAVQFKQVLDARGIYFPIDDLPEDADYIDDAGKARVVPLPDVLPMVALTRGVDDQWRFSRQTAEAIPGLYTQTFSSLSLLFQDWLPPVFHTQAIGPFLWQYLYAVLLVATAWLAGTVVRLLLRGRVRQLLDRANIPFNVETYKRTNTPVVAAIIFGVTLWGLPDLQLSIGLSGPLAAAAWIGLWVSILIASSRFILVGAEVAKSYTTTTASKLDDQAIPLFRQSAQLLVLVVGVLYGIDAMGFDVWKLAAGVGIGGLAFALAAQDTVANLFGSVNIFLDRPFQIGDWVKVGGVEGVVEEVGFRSTRVRTFYNSLVTIPNSQLTNANVDNLGLRPRRRVKLVLGLTYDTPPDTLEAFTEGVRAILAAHPLVQRSYEVHVYNLSDSAIEILAYYHVVTSGWHDELVTRSQNLLEFIRLAGALDVSFAFPTTSVHLESTPEHRQPAHDSPPLEQLRATFDSFGPGGQKARPLGPDFGRSWTVQAREGTTSRGSASDSG